jgi:hypothetical protein
MGRAFLAPGEHSINPILISFKQSFNRTISSISDPSKHPKPIGSTFGFHSEKHALHPAADNGMGSDFIFHGSPPGYILGIGGFLKMNVEHRTSKVDNFVKSRIFPFFWIPAFAGMTIIKLISDRYHRRHTREGGYPVFKTTFYDSINLE